jgi:membrane protease YdiL (CAAX protease family)
MLKFIRGWSPRVEAILVILGAFGYPVVDAVLVLAGIEKTGFSEFELLMAALYELAALASVGAFLYVRGWDIKRFGLNPERPDPLIAVGLAALIWLLLVFQVSLAQVLQLIAIEPDSASKLPLDSMFVVVLVVLYSFIDAAFEELFLCGYLIVFAKEHRRLVLGVNASMVLRAACHLDGGLIGIIFAVAFGVVFTGWYVKSGRLWPVILAHAFINLFLIATA